MCNTHTGSGQLKSPLYHQSAAVCAVHDVWAVIINLEDDQELAAGGASVVRFGCRHIIASCLIHKHVFLFFSF